MPLRNYLFTEDGLLCRVAQRLAEELPFGRDAVPEFSGTRQRLALVVVENQDGRPARILDARGSYWQFDAEGRIDEDLRERWAEHLDTSMAAARAKRAAVVDLVPEIKRREIEARNTWALTADDVDRIAADLWPGVHGPADEVTSVKGKAPRKPPLTSEARWALDDIAKHVNAITGKLNGLSERSLKGLAFEAAGTSTVQEERSTKALPRRPSG